MRTTSMKEASVDQILHRKFKSKTDRNKLKWREKFSMQLITLELMKNHLGAFYLNGYLKDYPQWGFLIDDSQKRLQDDLSGWEIDLGIIGAFEGVQERQREGERESLNWWQLIIVWFLKIFSRFLKKKNLKYQVKFNFANSCYWRATSNASTGWKLLSLGRATFPLERFILIYDKTDEVLWEMISAAKQEAPKSCFPGEQEGDLQAWRDSLSHSLHRV